MTSPDFSPPLPVTSSSRSSSAAPAMSRAPMPSPPRHKHPGSLSRARAALRRRRLFRWIAGLAAAALCLAGAARLLFPPPQPPTPAETLAMEMEGAVGGSGSVRHSLGGSLTLLRRGDGVTVIADKVPPPVCVQVGWALAQKGVVTVNGLFTQRLSGAKLSEMCYQTPEGAKIAWAISRARQ